MSSIKNLIKKIYHIWWVHLFFHTLRIAYLHWFYYPIHYANFKDVRKYKNCHKDGRCFIVATGPSLTLEDLNLLDGEMCFGMNSIYKYFNHTKWRPNYYAIFDETVYQKIKEEIDDISFDCVFTPDYLTWNTRNMHKLPCLPNRCVTAEERKHCKKWTAEKMSDDISKCVYSGASVVYFITQICFYMGFNEIYLIGADCSNFNQHSSLARYKGEDKISGSEAELTRGIMKDYQIIKEKAEKKGVKVYNATRGGKLEVFPRVDLDTLEFLRKH